MQIKRVFSYQPATRLTATRVIGHAVQPRGPAEVVIPTGISGRILRFSELDGPRSCYYFTTARGAIEAFIARAETALAGPCDAQNRKAWREALKIARQDLSSQIRARRDV